MDGIAKKFYNVLVPFIFIDSIGHFLYETRGISIGSSSYFILTKSVGETEPAISASRFSPIISLAIRRSFFSLANCTPECANHLSMPILTFEIYVTIFTLVTFLKS